MSDSMTFTHQIQEHYAPRNLSAVLLEALSAAGKDVNHLTLEDLAPLDEFHIRGRQATQELASLLDLTPAHTVLDVGSGLGGPTRFLAATYGCQVTGLDLTEEFCQAARMLADRLGLSGRITYRQGNALDLPFSDEEFDVTWTQHASMNIADKPGLYREIDRVLKPGGTFAMYDIVAGQGGPVYFPAPWSHVPENSFLIHPEELRPLLKERGFQIKHWEDDSPASLEAFSAVLRKIEQNGLPPLSFGVFLGPDFRQMVENVVRNLKEDRIRVLRVVAHKA